MFIFEGLTRLASSHSTFAARHLSRSNSVLRGSLPDAQTKFGCHHSSAAVKRPYQRQPTLNFFLSFTTTTKHKKNQSGSEGSYAETLDTSTWKSRVNKRWTPFTVVLICVPLLTFGLGTWQVQRLKWKLHLIEDLEHKMRIDPITLPKSTNPDVIPEFEYRKVRVMGNFDHSREILIESRTRESTPGYHLITPLVRSDGGETILINRGFIGREFKDPSSRPASLTGGTIEVIGMLRKQESKSIFQPENKRDPLQWYFVDIADIASYLETAPVLVDAITYGNSGELKQMMSKGTPIGRSPQIQLRNMHVTYILTWYGLSAITSVMAFRLLRRRLSGRSKFAGVQ